MTDAKKVLIVPMANLVHGQVFDKRAIQVPFERVVAAVNEIDVDFGALLQEGKGYTLLLDPITLAMVKAQQEQFQQPQAQPQYMRQPHMMMGGYYGSGIPPMNFGLIPNGHDRVLILSGQVLTAELNVGQLNPLNPHQVAALQFGAVLDEILGDAPGVNRGFVAE
ncbi:hypothetical protein D3C85_128090 [compost metagenome]